VKVVRTPGFARRAGWAVALTLLSVAPARGQEADVEAAVRATLDAWRSAEYTAFVASYHPDARGFFLDGGDVIEGFNLEALEATAEAGFQADVELTDLDVAVYGDAAVAVGLLEGALTLPGGLRLEGVWRYSETRIRDGGAWRIVQFHISRREGG
jgi:ketosteroid isomerase-like protein